jgi:hypothetical protein
VTTEQRADRVVADNLKRITFARVPV